MQHITAISCVIGGSTLLALGLVCQNKCLDNDGNHPFEVMKPVDDKFKYESEHIKNEDFSAKKYVKELDN